MSAAAAETVGHDGDAPVSGNKKGKKKLIVMIAVAVLLAAGVGAGAVMWKKKQAAVAAAAQAKAEGEDGDAVPAKHAAAHKDKDDHKSAPAFLPLDAFVVNLADKESERYAQIGITLELSDAKFADQIKAYMPAIRNGILLVLAHKSSQELLSRSGKEKLASEIVRESVRPLGIELDGADSDDKAADKDEDKADHGDKGEKTALADSPVKRVHFSSFIIQ